MKKSFMELPKTSLLQSAVSDRLFRSRIVIISGGIDQDLAANITSQLIALSSFSSEPITVFINSQGGHVESGDTIHDVIRFIDAKVRMIGTGWVASAGAFIYVSVPTEDRYCLPNTRFLLHQPLGGASGSGSDIAIEAEQIVLTRTRINTIIARQTGQPFEKIEEDSNRNFWLGAEDAREYGLVGHIIDHVNEVK